MTTRSIINGIAAAAAEAGVVVWVVGWYRRSPRPHFEMRRLKLDNGEVVTSYYYPVTQALVYITFLTGLALMALDVLLVFGPRLA